MLFSELGHKEIVNLSNGERLGLLIDSDIRIDESTGKIIAFLMPERRIQIKFFGENNHIEIPWESIRKIGQDMIIVELENY